MSVTDPLGGHPPVTGGPGGARETAARWAMLPLRLFLGFTFLYAGIDKYVDGGPFSSVMNTDTMEGMLLASRDDAAVPWLVDRALDAPELTGHGVAVAEIVLGAAVLLGLRTRWAAGLGTLLALSFWLTVTWSTDPYYFGADLPLLFGFVTLALAGGGPYTLDGLLGSRPWFLPHRNDRIFR
ncbi:DoxX family membrane protein [Streptomyces sp. 3MP-14]|uniref:DoxX family membrane protein n=1 Tax=Streptomyces mimosae TaxID=2586635 RepID=A0A5N6AGT2_9ACTN|nr:MULTISPECIES: DoxX family protein [Streptomyces]KAB8167263.1 DoxX family membrane protein [Streptomyces mimosae]KAB8177203.1 DoxX family membrane protein [Streptomyces sp. 3MP-14]